MLELGEGFERDFLRRALAFYADELHLIGADGTLTKIDVPDSAMTDVHREWCTVELREDWGSFTAGSLLAARFDDVLAGTPSWEVLFEPTDSSSLAGYACSASMFGSSPALPKYRGTPGQNSRAQSSQAPTPYRRYAASARVWAFAFGLCLALQSSRCHLQFLG